VCGIFLIYIRYKFITYIIYTNNYYIIFKFVNATQRNEVGGIPNCVFFDVT